MTKNGKVRQAPIRGIRTLTGLKVYELASLADCGSPAEGRSRYRRAWSPGAKFLSDVRDAVVEGIRCGNITDDDSWDDRGIAHEIADNAPDVYTYGRWREFTDLAAWQEENELGEGWGDDLTQAAGVALYQIADRLVHALVEAWREARS